MDSSLDLACLAFVQPMIDYLREKKAQGGLFCRSDISFFRVFCFCSAYDRLSEREGDPGWTLFSTPGASSPS